MTCGPPPSASPRTRGAARRPALLASLRCSAYRLPSRRSHHEKIDSRTSVQAKSDHSPISSETRPHLFSIEGRSGRISRTSRRPPGMVVPTGWMRGLRDLQGVQIVNSLTGPPGSGKSHLMRETVRARCSRTLRQTRLLVCRPSENRDFPYLDDKSL